MSYNRFHGFLSYGNPFHELKNNNSKVCNYHQNSLAFTVLSNGVSHRSQIPVPYRLTIALNDAYSQLYSASLPINAFAQYPVLCSFRLPGVKAICTELTVLLSVSCIPSTVSIAPLSSYKVSQGYFLN